MNSQTVNFHTLCGEQEVADFLGGTSLFSGLPRPLLLRLARHARVRHVLNRNLIHARGDAPDGLYAVVSGSVRATASLADGREHLLAVFGPGDWFGESSQLDGLPRAYSARAQQDSVLLQLNGQPFNTLIQGEILLYQRLAALLCERVRLSLLLLESSALLNTGEQLARRLLLMAASQRAPVTLEMSQEDLSQMLGVTRQSVHKQLKLWQQQGLVSQRYRRLVLNDLGALARIAGQAGEPGR